MNKITKILFSFISFSILFSMEKEEIKFEKKLIFKSETAISAQWEKDKIFSNKFYDKAVPWFFNLMKDNNYSQYKICINDSDYFIDYIFLRNKEFLFIRLANRKTNCNLDFYPKEQEIKKVGKQLSDFFCPCCDTQEMLILDAELRKNLKKKKILDIFRILLIEVDSSDTYSIFSLNTEKIEDFFKIINN